MSTSTALLLKKPHAMTGTLAGLEEAYISYEVVTTTSLPQFSGGRFSVRRRFRDVVSLSNLLPKLLHGRCGVSNGICRVVA